MKFRVWLVRTHRRWHPGLEARPNVLHFPTTAWLKCSHENLRSLELEAGRGWKCLDHFVSRLVWCPLPMVSLSTTWRQGRASSRCDSELAGHRCGVNNLTSIYWNLLYHWEMLDCWGMFGAMFGSQQKALTTPNLVWYRPRGVEPDVHGAGYLGPPQRRRSGCQILRGIPRRSSSQAFGVSTKAG